MSHITNAGADAILNHVFRGDGTMPTIWYFCLCTADPGVSATGSNITEATYGGYDRVSMPRGSSYFNVSLGLENEYWVVYPEATSSVGSITHWAICDSATAGNCWFYGDVDNGGGSPTIGDRFVWKVSDFALLFDDDGYSGLKDFIFEHLFVEDIDLPTEFEIALGKSATFDVFDECDYDGYARVTKAIGSTNWTASSGGSGIKNATAITFPTRASSSGDDEVYSVCAIFNDMGSSRKYGGGALTSPITTLAVGDNPEIAISGLTIDID